MALSNHERVGKALELLRAGLMPFVEREFKAKFGEGWAFEIRDTLTDTHLGANKDESVNDVAALLVAMDRKWGDVFKLVLGKTERSLVNELIAVRNRWAHQETFSSDDAYRALDSAGRLLSAVSAPQAEDVEKMKMELLRVRFDEQARSEKRKTAGIAIESDGDGQSETLARSGDTAQRRGQWPLPSGRVRRRFVAGASGRRHGRIPEPGRVLPPHLSDRSLKRMLVGAVRRLTGERWRPGGAAADQLRRRQDALDAGALSPVLRHRTERAGRHRCGDARSRGSKTAAGPTCGACRQQDFTRQPRHQAGRHGGSHVVGRTGLATWRQDKRLPAFKPMTKMPPAPATCCENCSMNTGLV